VTSYIFLDALEEEKRSIWKVEKKGLTEQTIQIEDYRKMLWVKLNPLVTKALVDTCHMEYKHLQAPNVSYRESLATLCCVGKNCGKKTPIAILGGSENYEGLGCTISHPDLLNVPFAMSLFLSLVTCYYGQK